MNLDLASIISHGDKAALQDFFLVHRFVHDSEADAISAQLGIPFPTFGVADSSAEEAWVETMRAEKGQPPPPALSNWLALHAQIHQAAYAAIGGTANLAPDLSVADFAAPEQFYDWLYVHQTMHDYEQSSLGVS